MLCRATALWDVDHVDRVSLPEEVLCPAGAPIRSGPPERANLAAAVYEDQRIFVLLRLWNLIFHIHLARPAAVGVLSPAHEKITLLIDVLRCRCPWRWGGLNNRRLSHSD